MFEWGKNIFYLMFSKKESQVYLGTCWSFIGPEPGGPE